MLPEDTGITKETVAPHGTVSCLLGRLAKNVTKKNVYYFGSSLCRANQQVFMLESAVSCRVHMLHFDCSSLITEKDHLKS